jgi:hypothetical protein
MASSFDVFLALHPFRANIREFQILMRPLGDLETRYLRGAEGFYSHRIDTALVVLRFSERALEKMDERTVALFAGRSGLPMIIPDKLSAEDRRRFFLEHLTSYNTYVQHYASRDEQYPLLERVVVSLAEHVRGLPASPDSHRFDIASELPVYGDWRRHRLGSVAGS